MNGLQVTEIKPQPKIMKHKRIKPLNRSVDYKGINKLINGAINKLGKDDYEILYEFYFKNTSIHQLARNIDVPRAAVRNRRAKALKKLKKMIEKSRKINFSYEITSLFFY